MKNSLVCHTRRAKSWQDKLINFKWALGVFRVEIRVDDAVFPHHVCLKVSLFYDSRAFDKYANYAKEKKYRIWLILHFRLLQMNNRRVWQLFTNVVRKDLRNKFSTPLLISRRQIFCRHRERNREGWRKWQIGEYHSHETVFVLWLNILKIRHGKENERKKLVSISELEMRRFFSKKKIHKHPPTSFMNNNADVTRNEETLRYLLQSVKVVSSRDPLRSHEDGNKKLSFDSENEKLHRMWMGMKKRFLGHFSHGSVGSEREDENCFLMCWQRNKKRKNSAISNRIVLQRNNSCQCVAFQSFIACLALMRWISNVKCFGSEAGNLCMERWKS